MKNFLRQVLRFFETRVFDRQTFVSYEDAYKFIRQTHLCWGGGRVDENLISDVNHAFYQRFLTQEERVRLFKEIKEPDNIYCRGELPTVLQDWLKDKRD